MMNKEGDWDYYNKNESSLKKKDLLNELRGLLDVEDYLVPFIEEKMKTLLKKKHVNFAKFEKL